MMTKIMMMIINDDNDDDNDHDDDNQYLAISAIAVSISGCESK